MPARISHATWLSRAVAAHGDKYDYSKAEYLASDIKVEIVCPEHGSFMQLPSSHTGGHGCPGCKADKIGGIKRLGLQAFIVKARIIHGDRYTYPDQPYLNVSSKLRIVCPEHGEFEQTAHGHLSGKGCDICGGKALLTRDAVLGRFKLAHGDAYDYSKVVYDWASRKVEILCPTHGVFWQIAQDHWAGHGCPSCSYCGPSKVELEIGTWVASLGVTVEHSNRTIIHPLEIDIWLPEHNVGIEYHGLYWHTEERVGNLHAEKYQRAQIAGVRLIQIFEDEWGSRKHAVQQVILNAIGRTERKVMARKCVVVEVAPEVTKDFFNQNHVQGLRAFSGTCLGLEFEGELVAAMLFKRPVSSRGRHAKGDVWELSRYATTCSVQGGASRLLAAFPNVPMVSYVDHRYFTGGVYEVLGFKKQYTAVDYEYLFMKRRIHKSALQKRALANLMGDAYNPALTERELTAMLGAKRILNAGRTTYFRDGTPQ